MQPLARNSQHLQWQSTPDVLTVCDSERHLGHALRFDSWHAFDATKLNETGDGWMYLGVFETIIDARAAIAGSLEQLESLTAPLVMTAGSGFVH